MVLSRLHSDSIHPSNRQYTSYIVWHCPSCQCTHICSVLRKCHGKNCMQENRQEQYNQIQTNHLHTYIHLVQYKYQKGMQENR